MEIEVAIRAANCVYDTKAPVAESMITFTIETARKNPAKVIADLVSVGEEAMRNRVQQIENEVERNE